MELNIKERWNTTISAVSDAAVSSKNAIVNTSKSISNTISERNARKTLERNLLRRKELAREYEANRVPAGDNYYKLIYDACQADIAQFCDTYKEDKVLISMQYPFLRSLQAKANPVSVMDHQSGILAKAFSGLAAVALLLFLSGAAAGLFTGGNSIVNHFFV